MVEIFVYSNKEAIAIVDIPTVQLDLEFNFMQVCPLYILAQIKSLLAGDVLLSN